MNEIDLLFNQVPVVGNQYKFGDWKLYAVHDDNNVRGFFGDYRFLSNFENAPTYFEGLLYPSSENAYQAAKVTPAFRVPFQTCSAAESKRMWKRPAFTRLHTPEGWDKAKYNIMVVILADKFFRNPELRAKLLDTKAKYLEELNHWKDSYWGVDIKQGGENHLGKVLMKLRDLLK